MAALYTVCWLVLLLLVEPAHAWLTASDGYNIGVFMGSILGGVLLIMILFFVLYYCWLRQVLFDYRQHRTGGYDQRQYASGYYKKKPPPPDYSLAGRGGAVYESRSSPVPRPITTLSGQVIRSGGSPTFGARDDSTPPSAYTRTATVRASPSPTRLASHSPVHMSRGPTPSGRVPSPSFIQVGLLLVFLKRVSVVSKRLTI